MRKALSKIETFRWHNYTQILAHQDEFGLCAFNAKTCQPTCLITTVWLDR